MPPSDNALIAETTQAPPPPVNPEAAADAPQPEIAEGATPEAEGPAPETPPAESDPPARAKPSLQDRIGRLSAQKRAAEEEARFWKERALAQPTPQVPEPQPDPEPPQPRREDYQNPDDYDAALVKWASDAAARKVSQDAAKRDSEARARADREAAERTQREEGERAQQAWQDRRAKFVADHPDYEEVAESDDLAISEVMAGAIMTAENGPEIAYWLGEHPEEAARIAGMTRGVYTSGPLAGRPAADAARQLVEMGKIAARIEARTASPPKAPPPITPVRSSAAAVGKDPEDMTVEEYAAWRKSRGTTH